MSEKYHPPLDAICDECIARTRHPLDVNGMLYYCGHRENMAIKLPNMAGWHIITELKSEAFLNLVEQNQKELFATLAHGVGHA